jgi:hypothetical protein
MSWREVLRQLLHSDDGPGGGGSLMTIIIYDYFPRAYQILVNKIDRF